MLTRKQITARLKSLTGRLDVVNETIHETGVSCLEHGREFGDFTLLTDLHEILGPTNQKRLKAWAKVFGPIAFLNGQFRRVKGKSKVAWNITGATLLGPLAMERDKKPAVKSEPEPTETDGEATETATEEAPAETLAAPTPDAVKAFLKSVVDSSQNDEMNAILLNTIDALSGMGGADDELIAALKAVA